MVDLRSPSLAVSSSLGSQSEWAQGQARRRSRKIKRGFDLSVALLCLIAFLPVVIGVTLVILLAQGRPILIRHRRIGLHGKSFSCLKFRSMRINGDEILARHLASDPNAQAEWSASRKLKNDPRVTPVGQVLRKTSLDELPQLINVIKGEMSLVGPRPIVQAEMELYGAQITHYLSVKPGITGPWQVGGRTDTSFSKRIELDAEYARNVGLMLDLKILAKTVPAVLRTTGSY